MLPPSFRISSRIHGTFSTSSPSLAVLSTRWFSKLGYVQYTHCNYYSLRGCVKSQCFQMCFWILGLLRCKYSINVCIFVKWFLSGKVSVYVIWFKKSLFHLSIQLGLHPFYSLFVHPKPTTSHPQNHPQITWHNKNLNYCLNFAVTYERTLPGHNNRIINNKHKQNTIHDTAHRHTTHHSAPSPYKCRPRRKGSLERGGKWRSQHNIDSHTTGSGSGKHKYINWVKSFLKNVFLWNTFVHLLSIYM